jgi:hypothetical protein
MMAGPGPPWFHERGCCIPADPVAFHCSSCHHEWGGWPRDDEDDEEQEPDG